MKSEPPWVGDESALVVIDWSWWLNKAFRIGGLDGMTSNVIGWLCATLAYNPAHLAIALDAPGATHRHRMQHPTDPEWKYKAGRDPKPADFYTLSDRCTELADLHSIPVLWTAEREADDVIATVTARAREAGYRVWICSHDKDLCGLVEHTKEAGIIVGTWDNFEGTMRGPAEVFAQFGVRPDQMADLLAIEGDNGDNVPGVPSLGRDKAAALLGFFDTLSNALEAPPWPAEQYDVVEGNLRAMAKRIKITSDPDAKAALEKQRADMMGARKLARSHAVLREHAALALFSRDLTALDCGAPVAIPWEDLPVGGFRVDELRERYRALGYTRKAAEVPDYPKRAPYVLPYEA